MATDAIRTWIRATLRRTSAARRGRAGLRIDGLEARVNPAPYAVSDINAVPSRVGSSPLEFVEVNGTLFFSANDPVRGTELWKSAGTAAGTVLVKDVRSGLDSSYPSALTAVNDTLFFTAGDGADGLGLWKSDGTTAGTVLVRQFLAGAGTVDPRSLTAVGDTLFFMTSAETGGSELWKSDGTTAGTVLVKGALESLIEGSYGHLTDWNGTLYFAASDGATGLELWKSDGTTAGTAPVKDIVAGAAGSEPHHLTVVNGALYFTADAGEGDRELWKSDGTAPGTVRVKDIWPGANGSVPYDLAVANGVLYFSADNGTAGRELWKSDGTAAGTVQVRNIVAGAEGSYPAFMTAVGGTIYFAAGAGAELWKSDGTAAGTVEVKDIRPGVDGSYPSAFTAVGRALYFVADDGATGSELWKSDGTAAGTTLVKDIRSGVDGSYPQTLISINGTLLFAADDGATGVELWQSDGTAAGTALVKDVWAGTGNSAPGALTTLNGTLFVGADDGIHGPELWKSDGTATGTVLIKDINPGAGGSFPVGLTVMNGAVYFTADDGTSGTELWKTDGTGAGTVQVANLAPGSAGSFPRELTAVNSTLYFTATVSGSGRELWKTDGTEAGTVQVKDIRSGSSSSSPASLTGVSGTLYFAANDGSTGNELWKSDGTEDGTVQVKDIFVGGLPSGPESLTVVNGTLYFTANDGTTHRELWKSDGTAVGTVQVKDISATAASVPAYLTNLNGTLYFTADDDVVGRELWKTDGTAAGTVLVKDIATGALSSTPLGLAAANGAIFLRADDGVSGPELWKSDGTAAGTVLVKDIRSGAWGSNPWFLTEADGTVFFRAHDGVTGEELWRTDGTAAGTVLVADIVPGSGASYPMSLTPAGSRLYFTAITEALGQELWALDPPPPDVTFTATSQSGAEAAGTMTITAQLSAVSHQAVTIPFTASGTATGGEDYSITASPITIPAGQLTGTAVITVTNDAADEPDETVIVTMGVPTNAVAGTTTVHTATITDDDPAPVVSFTTASGSAAEGAATRTVTVSLSAASGRAVTVPYTVGGSATDPADYTIAPASPLTFAPGETSKTITLTVVNDPTDEPDETAVLTLGTPTNATLGGAAVHTATIADDDAAPTVSFATASGSAAESLATRTVTVSLSAASGLPISVPYSVGGSATDPTDYSIAPSSPLTFAPGVVSRDITIAVVNDTTDEPDETVVLTLGSPTNATLGGTTSYTETITDDDAAPTVSFTTAAESAAEGVTTRTVTVSLSALSGQTVTVPYSVSGTATNATDYTIAPASPLTFAPGVVSQDITITVVNDATDEPDETVVLTLGTPTNATLGASAVHTAIITDDDAAPTVSFTTAAGSAAEGVTTRTITVSLSAASGLPIVVPYGVSGSATDPADYTIAPASPLTFAPGETSKTITLTVVNDPTDEPDETAVLTLGTPTNATLGGAAVHTATIADDDAAPTVSFATASGSAAEGVTTRTITVSLSAASGHTVTVPYTVGGSATNPADYTMVPASPLSFAPGETSRTITLTVVNDPTDEADETVVLTLGATTNATLGSTTVHTATITDDDPAPTVAFVVPGASAAESATTRTITVSLSAASGQTVTVPYTVGGSATNPADYTIAPASPLTFAQEWLPRTITLTVVNDTTDEPDETVVLTLGTPTNGTPGSTTVHTGTITDDDAAPTVSFATASGSAAEGVTTRTITVSLSEPSSFSITVPYSVGGDATNPADYTIAPTGPLTFAPGETTQTITLTVVNDTVLEPDETVILTLDAPTNATLGTILIHIETIANDEMPTVSFATAAGSAAEGVSSRTVTVSLSAASAFPITVTYSVGGSATNPADFSIAPASPLTFAPGETTQTITLNVIEDALDELDETIVLTLGVPTNAALGPTPTHVETIADDDLAPTVSFATASGSAAEAVTTRTITVSLSAASGQIVTVPYAVGGSATNPADYAIAPASPLTFAPGETSRTITLTVVDDAMDEPDETIVPTLGTPTNATLGPTTVHTATITDDDTAPTVSFGTSTGSVAEGVTTRTLTVSLSAASALPISLPYSVGGTATDPTDYAITPASPLTFAPGETTQTITLTVVNDTMDELDETVVLTLGTPTNATLGATTSHTETIVDDDPAPTVSFTTASESAAEGVTTRTVTVSLSGLSALPITVPYSVGGTATHPTDYTIAPASPLTFAPGEVTRAVTLIIVDDAEQEPDETVVLTLGAPTNATVGTTAVHTETISNDDEVPTVSFTAAAGSAAEVVATRTVAVTLSAASAFPVTVPYSVGGSATNPADYTMVPASPLSFAPGETSRTIALTVVNDPTDEADETVVLTLGAPTNATLGSTTVHTATITDDDPTPTVSFATVAGSASEFVTTRTVTVALSAPSGFPIAVPYSVSGSATDPADYTIAPGSPLTFAPGETSKTITLTVVDEAVFEPDEEVVLTLGAPTNAALGAATVHTLTIADDDGPPAVSFAAAAGSAAETVTTRTITVALSDPSAFPVTVPYAVAGTAADPADYTVAPAGPLTFTPGQTTQTITLTVVNDTDHEFDETVVLTLGTPTNATLGAPATYTETIVEDEPAPAVAFAAATGSAFEGVATRTVTVSLSGPSTLTVTVPFTVGGTATNPDDYTVTPASPLVFAPGETTKTITFTVADDAVVESDETIVVTLGAPTNGTLGATGTYTETIAEEFGIVVSPPSATYTTEGGSTVTFTVVLTAVPTGDVTIPLASSDPTEGTASAAQLVFTGANAGTPQTVTVTGAGDTTPDLNQVYSVILGAAQSGDARFAGLDPADLNLVNVEFLPKGVRKFVDADGDKYTVKLTGPGQVGVIQTGPGANGPGAIDRIVLSPAVDPTKSRLSVTVTKVPGSNKVVDVGTVAGPGLKAFTALNSNLVGEGALFDGYLGSLKVRDIKNGADVLAGGTPDKRTAIKAVDVESGTTVQLGSGISTLRVARFGDGRIEAPRIGTLAVSGNTKRGIPADFTAAVRLTGVGVPPTAKTLGTMTVAGTIRDSAIEAAGNVGSVRAKRFLDSSLLLGLDGTMLAGVKLGSFTASGFNGSADPAFADSDVTAERIGTVTLRSVGTTHPDEPFGVTAGISLGRLKVATPAFLYRPLDPSPQGLSLDPDADLEFVVRVG